MRYAQQTSVSVDNSRNEIERILKRYGADSFQYGTKENKAVIMFEKNGKHIRFVLDLPDINDRAFTHTSNRGSRRTREAQEKEHEQSCRQKWRALCLVIKAKLEAIDSGISIFEQEFMANILLPNGQTAGEYMLPQIQVAYEQHSMPPMLDFGGSL